MLLGLDSQQVTHSSEIFNPR